MSAPSLSKLTVELASLVPVRVIEKAGFEARPRLRADRSQRVYVDRDMWEKIVLNLVSNAFKHTFDGNVSVALRERERRRRARVRDTHRLRAG